MKVTDTYFTIHKNEAPIETWLCEYEDKNIVYIPLHNLLLTVNSKAVNNIKDYIKDGQANATIDGLLDLVKENPAPETTNRDEEKYEPTVIGLGLTDVCQLRCVYCHSESGEDYQCTNMPYEIAEKTILMAAKNAKKLNRALEVGFIGPGEQTTVWELFTKVVLFIYKVAEEYEIKTNLSIATNGCYGDEKRSFLVEYFDGVSLSFDGYETIQNMQRPRRGGEPSFDLVFGTAKYFYDHVGKGRKNFSFVLRPTVSQYGLDHIEELLSFFRTNFPGIPVGFEAINPLGRGAEQMCGGKVVCPDQDQFASKMAELVEREGPKMILNSGASRLGELRKSFCKALAMPGVNVTPTGEISACQRDGCPDFFKYGYYDSDKKEFVLDQSKIDFFRTLTVDAYPECSECVAKYHCAGDCCDLRRAGISRCKVNVNLVHRMILNEVEGKNQD